MKYKFHRPAIAHTAIYDIDCTHIRLRIQADKHHAHFIGAKVRLNKVEIYVVGIPEIAGLAAKAGALNPV